MTRGRYAPAVSLTFLYLAAWSVFIGMFMYYHVQAIAAAALGGMFLITLWLAPLRLRRYWTRYRETADRLERVGMAMAGVFLFWELAVFIPFIVVLFCWTGRFDSRGIFTILVVGGLIVLAALVVCLPLVWSIARALESVPSLPEPAVDATSNPVPEEAP